MNNELSPHGMVFYLNQSNPWRLGLIKRVWSVKTITLPDSELLMIVVLELVVDIK